jgi:hypothetical protein
MISHIVTGTADYVMDFKFVTMIDPILYITDCTVISDKFSLLISLFTKNNLSIINEIKQLNVMSCHVMYVTDISNSN